MKALMVHVGNETVKDPLLPDSHYLQRISFHDGQLKYFKKFDIINADMQMQSLIDAGVDISYGHLTYRKSLAQLVKAGFRLRALVKEHEADLVHVLWGTTTALMCVIFSPVPVVISFCGSDLLGNVNLSGRKNTSGIISSLLSQIAALFASRIITKSQHMKSQLWVVSRNKATVIPNGLSLDNFFPMDQKDCRNRLKWDAHTRYILFFDGGGAIVKDRPLAEKVFEIVKDRLENVELKIMGGINHDELPIYYNAGDLLLITSYHEGSNNSLKEARACDVPIVSVNCGDAGERLEGVENSFVVYSRDPNEIADKVIHVLQSGSRSNGASLSGDVNLAVIANKVIEVYNQAVGI